MSIQTITWVDATATVRLLDQTKLPHTVEYLDCTSVDQLVDAIKRLVVRGAPALGAAGALGVALALHQSQDENWSQARLTEEIDRIRDARPTAVNLAWGVDRVKPLADQSLEAALLEAKKVVEEDASACRAIGNHGADWLNTKISKKKLVALTHCNAGALATTEWGTALGVIRELNKRGKIEFVFVDETRPLLQGSRLTAWELGIENIDYQVQVDGAAASTIMRGLVDVAIIGADRIASNGDTANKIGSLGVALACHQAGVPFMVAAPTSTIDMRAPNGEAIHIEMRDEEEVLKLAGHNVAPTNARGFNPAFDVTPHEFIDVIVTENGVVEPRHHANMRSVVGVAA
jgi:methylthioribose-1-phosphate isomerase